MRWIDQQHKSEKKSCWIFSDKDCTTGSCFSGDWSASRSEGKKSLNSRKIVADSAHPLMLELQCDVRTVGLSMTVSKKQTLHSHTEGNIMVGLCHTNPHYNESLFESSVVQKLTEVCRDVEKSEMIRWVIHQHILHKITFFFKSPVWKLNCSSTIAAIANVYRGEKINN